MEALREMLITDHMSLPDDGIETLNLLIESTKLGLKNCD